MQEIIARLGTGQGMMGRGLETISYPLRKPLIGKQNKLGAHGRMCEQKLHKIRRGCLPIRLIPWEDLR